jgi:hypothetical protein
MNESVKAKTGVPFKDIIRDEVTALATISDKAKAEFTGIIDKLPLLLATSPPSSARSRRRRPAPAACSPSSSPTSARAAANACRSAATTTRCA